MSAMLVLVASDELGVSRFRKTRLLDSYIGKESPVSHIALGLTFTCRYPKSSSTTYLRRIRPEVLRFDGSKEEGTGTQ